MEFRESLHGGSLAPDAILFVDQETGRSPELAALTRAMSERGRVVVLGGSLHDSGMVALLRERALDHVIGDQGTPDEHELAVTSAKLHSGDIFGLEKYMAWGVQVTEIEVASYADKVAALDQLGRSAESVGARRRLVNRIQSTADELLMNALYDAPSAASASGAASAGPSALLRYGCDGRHVAVSVLDRFGLLDKRAVVDAVLRARAELGRPRTEGGAGLGLYFVLSSVTRFIVNVQPGRLTEVVCLFDLRERGRDAAGWARSLHVFTAGM
ncbi:MAG TPA: hypothetical protein VNO33_14895 [Kofleriaceae bacterium]|nr:hypothetical protein [Kofleriaceae bacterium]